MLIILFQTRLEASNKIGSEVFNLCNLKVFIYPERIEETKKKILDISRTVLKNSSDSRIYIFEQNMDMSTDKGYKVYSAKGNRFFTDYNTLAETLKEVSSSGTTENSAILSDAVGGIISVCDLNRETYAFSFFSQDGVIYRTENGYVFLDSAVEKNVDISVIAEIDDSLYNGYAHDMYKRSGGIILTDTEDYTEAVLNHIYGKKVNKEEEDTGEYSMILATGLSTVKLAAPITEEYAMLAATSEIDATQPDTDEDSLPDYMEINFSVKGADGKPLIEFVNGVVDLPKYGDCIDIKSELTYVERGFNRFDNVVINDIAFLNYVYDTVDVLPIVSDPTSEDGDWDRINDKDEYFLYPLKYEIVPCLDDIEEMAKKYNDDKGKNSFVLTCQFIRHFKYNKDVNPYWESAAGAVNEEFIKYVREKNRAVYDFYERCSAEENNIVLYDPITQEEEDFIHLFATLNAMCYKGYKKVLSNAEIVNDLLGWAGDLQSMIQTDLLIYYEDNMYGTDGNDRYFEREYIESLPKDVIFITMYNLFKGCDEVTLNGYNLYNTSFRNSDLLADADAVNIYGLKRKWENISVNDLINLYFSSVKNDNERFNSFIRNIAGKGDDGFIYGKMLYNRTLRYTNANIQSREIIEEIAFTNSGKWKLFFNAPVTQNVSEECARAFTVYIFERAGRVYEYK